jgi:hypothetical protein
MTHMPKLNDTQTILLSSASQRDDGSLYPLPEKFDRAGARVVKAVTGLVDTALLEERETIVAGAVHRSDGDRRYGLYITPAGLAAIGVVDGADGQDVPEVVVQSAAPRTTKIATVLTLLARPDGATLAELVAATDWLPHTTRAALTGLRKKGHAIERGKRDDVTCYAIAQVA